MVQFIEGHHVHVFEEHHSKKCGKIGTTIKLYYSEVILFEFLVDRSPESVVIFPIELMQMP
jgi:hypothetical protein